MRSKVRKIREKRIQTSGCTTWYTVIFSEARAWAEIGLVYPSSIPCNTKQNLRFFPYSYSICSLLSPQVGVRLKPSRQGSSNNIIPRIGPPSDSIHSKNKPSEAIERSESWGIEMAILFSVMDMFLSNRMSSKEKWSRGNIATRLRR